MGRKRGGRRGRGRGEGGGGGEEEEAQSAGSRELRRLLPLFSSFPCGWTQGQEYSPRPGLTGAAVPGGARQVCKSQVAGWRGTWLTREASPKVWASTQLWLVTATWNKYSMCPDFPIFQSRSWISVNISNF